MFFKVRIVMVTQLMLIDFAKTVTLTLIVLLSVQALTAPVFVSVSGIVLIGFCFNLSDF